MLRANRDIFPTASENVGQVNIIFSHTYMPPKFPLLLPPSNKSHIKDWHFEYPLYYNDKLPKLNWIEMGSKPVEKNVKQKLIEVIMMQKNKVHTKTIKTFVAIPTILRQRLEKSLENILEFRSVYYTFPHISVESLPEISNLIPIDDLHLDIVKHWEKASEEINEKGIARYILKKIGSCIDTVSLFGLSVIEVKLYSETVKTVEVEHLHNKEVGTENDKQSASKVKKARHSGSM